MPMNRPGGRKQRPGSWTKKPKAAPPPKPSPEALIERHVDQASVSEGPIDALLRNSGVAIQTIVAYLGVYQNDTDKVAQHFDLPTEEIEAAAAYYRMHKAEFDAQMSRGETLPTD
jgi:uncharacterized protein (DUF433 family)